jgi:hypothetical protein
MEKQGSHYGVIVYVGPGAPFFFGAAMALIALGIFGLARDEATGGHSE